MRINIALPLPHSFKSELANRIGKLKTELYKSSPHYLWLDKEEWRVRLGFYGKLTNVNDIMNVYAAVQQAVLGFGPVLCVTGQFITMPDNCPYYGIRHIVGLSFKKDNDRLAELSSRIAEKTNYLIASKYIQFVHPYIILLRKGRRRRPCFPICRINILELKPLECGFDRVVLYISDKNISGGVNVMQKSVRLM